MTQLHGCSSDILLGWNYYSITLNNSTLNAFMRTIPEQMVFLLDSERVNLKNNQPTSL